MRSTTARHPGAGLYIEQVLVRFTSPQPPEALKAAWEQTVAAVPALRAIFGEDESGYPRIFIAPQATPPWVDDSGSDPGWIVEERTTPFPTGAPESRCRYRPATGEWLWTFHHSLLDGRAIANVLKSFILRITGTPPLSDPVWCGSLTPHPDLTADAQSSWAALTMPQEEEPEPLVWDGTPGADAVPHRIRLDIPHPVAAALPGAAEKSGATVHNLVQWAWGFTLGRIFGLEAPVLGVVRSGHWAVESGKEAAGYLMATLPVPVNAAQDATLGDALKGYREAILKIRDFVAVDPRVAVTALGRPQNRPWEAIVMTENGSMEDIVRAGIPDGVISSLELLERTGESLSGSAWLGAKPEIEVEASPEAFSPEKADVIARTWLRTIELITQSEPSTRLADLEPLPGDVLSGIAAMESGGATLAPAGMTLWQAFDLVTGEQPEAEALGYAGKTITYAGLKQAAESLTSALYAVGVRPGDRVASRIDARRHASVVVLACARLQAVYMPFDADIPAERVQRMIEVAAPTAIIRDGEPEAVTAGLPAVHPEDHTAGELPPYQPHDPYEPFCLLFTSGSTGEPKGVINHHHGILNEVLAVGQMLDIGPADRVLQFASLGFDAALEEILGTLVAGAKLIPREEAILESFDKYQAFIVEHGISIADLPTAYWAAWCAWLAGNEQSPPPCVRGVIIGGEKAGAASTLAWNRSCDSKIPVFNTYGPTETAIVATASRLAIPADGGDPPIGRPLPGLKGRIVYKNGRLAAPGKVGELWLGGAGVGLGYWKRPETTAEVFITEPGSVRPDWYRTGDMARMDSAGTLHFLGRADDQVKIRGKRIEPGEIQARLETHPSVSRAHVGARTIKGQMILVAWVVAPGESSETLGGYLRKDLPSWMTPSAYVFLEDLPLNARGKVDRKKLPDPSEIAEESTEPQGEGSPLEVWMASLFAEVLGVEAATVRYDLDFAEQGGDSLSAMALATRLRQAGVDLDPGELVADSSPKLLAEKIDKNYGKARTEWEPVLRLRAGNPANPPLVLIHATPGDVLGYANLVAELPKSIPCLGVVSRSLHLPDQPHATIEEMAAAYIEALTPRLEGKKWVLGGWCYGGIVAFEMARQLVAAGKEPPLLIMIEAWADNPVSGLQALRLKAEKALALVTMPGPTKKLWQEARSKHQAAATANTAAEASDGFARSAVYQANMQAMGRHRMGSYPGEVHLFLSDKAAEDGTLPVRSGGWHILGAKCVLHPHSGNHSLALRPPYVSDLAADLTKLLSRVMDV